MSDILTVQETSLTSIADSIRKKTGKKNKLASPPVLCQRLIVYRQAEAVHRQKKLKRKMLIFLIMTEHSLPHIPRQRRRR